MYYVDSVRKASAYFDGVKVKQAGFNPFEGDLKVQLWSLDPD